MALNRNTVPNPRSSDDGRAMTTSLTKLLVDFVALSSWLKNIDVPMNPEIIKSRDSKVNADCGTGPWKATRLDDVQSSMILIPWNVN